MQIWLQRENPGISYQFIVPSQITSERPVIQADILEPSQTQQRFSDGRTPLVDRNQSPYPGREVWRRPGAVEPDLSLRPYNNGYRNSRYRGRYTHQRMYQRGPSDALAASNGFVQRRDYWRPQTPNNNPGFQITQPILGDNRLMNDQRQTQLSSVLKNPLETNNKDNLEPPITKLSNEGKEVVTQDKKEKEISEEEEPVDDQEKHVESNEETPSLVQTTSLHYSSAMVPVHTSNVITSSSSISTTQATSVEEIASPQEEDKEYGVWVRRGYSQCSKSCGGGS